MKRWHMGTMLLAGLLLAAPEARAGTLGALMGGYGGGPIPVGSTGMMVGGNPPTAGGMVGGMMGMGGCIGSTMGGACGCCGGMMGIGGFGGCCGLGGCGFSMTGCCGGLSGLGCCGGMTGLGGCRGGMMGMCGFGGCCGVYPMPAPTQTYSRWTPSPNKLYFYRTLHIHGTPPNGQALEFIVVHYPDRPKFFYFYDPVEKKYFGRYRLGASAGTMDYFALLALAERKANLKEIPESAYRSAGAMPTIPQVIRARPGTSVDAALQNVRLMRPPESIPDDLLGLPPEEDLGKKLK